MFRGVTVCVCVSVSVGGCAGRVSYPGLEQDVPRSFMMVMAALPRMVCPATLSLFVFRSHYETP